VLDVPVGHTFIRDGISTGIAMARQVTSDDEDDSGPDDPAELDALASRLEVTRRLDGLIARLRDALGNSGQD
jgi:hypothetical protein